MTGCLCLDATFKNLQSLVNSNCKLNEDQLLLVLDLAKETISKQSLLKEGIIALIQLQMMVAEQAEASGNIPANQVAIFAQSYFDLSSMILLKENYKSLKNAKNLEYHVAYLIAANERFGLTMAQSLDLSQDNCSAVRIHNKGSISIVGKFKQFCFELRESFPDNETTTEGKSISDSITLTSKALEYFRASKEISLTWTVYEDIASLMPTDMTIHTQKIFNHSKITVNSRVIGLELDPPLPSNTSEELGILNFEMISPNRDKKLKTLCAFYNYEYSEYVISY